MSEPLYTRDILRLAASIPHQRGFADLADSAEVRSPTCGSRIAMRVMLDADGRVGALEQAVEACAFGQAAASLVGAHAIGTDAAALAAALAGVDRWLKGDDAAVDSWPGLAVLAPARQRTGRHGAILLPWRALGAAIEKAPS